MTKSNSKEQQDSDKTHSIGQGGSDFPSRFESCQLTEHLNYRLGDQIMRQNSPQGGFATVMELRKLSNDDSRNHYLVTIGTSITEENDVMDELTSPGFHNNMGGDARRAAFPNIFEHLSPDRTSQDQQYQVDQRPRANSSPQGFTFSPTKPLMKRGPDMCSENNMVI